MGRREGGCWFGVSVSHLSIPRDGSSQKAKQTRLISVISLFSRLSRPKEATLGFVGTALCVCFIPGVFPYILDPIPPTGVGGIEKNKMSGNIY